MRARIFAILLITGSLLLGVLIYFTTRTNELLINTWLTSKVGIPFKEIIQSSIAGFRIPNQIIYSLPDGMWMLALTITILLIWDFRIDRKCLLWIAIALASGTGLECLQGLHLIKGWFDPIDMIYLISGALLPVFVLMIKTRLCKSN